jgi:hypothetical protein
MVPAKLVPKSEAWFHTPEWQAKERAADEAIARREVSGPFSSAGDLIRHLAHSPRRTRKQP